MRPQAELHAKKVRYEWWMLNETCRRITNGVGKSQVETNVYLESFLMHSRILCEFLSRARNDTSAPHKTDIVAGDFLDSDESWKVEKGEYIKQNWIKLQRSIAHLSYDRLDYEETGNKKWRIDKIYNEVELMWNTFIRKLPPTQQAWFTE